MIKRMYLDGEMPVIVMEHNIELCNTKVFNEDTGRWWWVHDSRLTPVAGDGAGEQTGEMQAVLYETVAPSSMTLAG